MEVKEAKEWNVWLVNTHKDADRPSTERSMVTMINDHACSKSNVNER